VKRLVWLFALAAAASSGCVSVEPAPEPHGAYKPGQRLVVLVFQSPGPWIVSSTESKLAGAAEILPVGFAVQDLEENRALAVSKNIEQYLPRPRYDEEFQQALLLQLRAALSTAAVQTGLEAGIAPEQIQRWNRARDQLEWRRSYFYSRDPDLPPARDYSRGLGLEEALVLQVYLSYGTAATEAGALQPEMAAAWRVYRGLNSRQLWEHVEDAVDAASSTTLVDIQTNPADLAARLEFLAPKVGQTVGREFVRVFTIAPSTAAAAASVARGGAGGATMAPPLGPGLLPLDFLLSLSSGNASGALPPPPPSPPRAPAPAAGPPLGSLGAFTPAVSTAAASVPVSAPPPAVPVSTTAPAALAPPPPAATAAP